jgi:hypothetical protein
MLISTSGLFVVVFIFHIFHQTTLEPPEVSAFPHLMHFVFIYHLPLQDFLCTAESMFSYTVVHFSRFLAVIWQNHFSVISSTIRVVGDVHPRLINETLVL